MSASQALKHLLGRLAGCNHAHLAFRALGTWGRRVIYVSHAGTTHIGVKSFADLGYVQILLGAFFETRFSLPSDCLRQHRAKRFLAANFVDNDLCSQVHGEKTNGARRFPLFAQMTAAIKAGSRHVRWGVIRVGSTVGHPLPVCLQLRTFPA
jgi:hypothetical protein